ncbi:hypothetical protein [Ideonella sp. YS5]|uniref:hypothetical protein n=1 Tax=Ideonella sp. YS5 TaxID=3453714 RepID=UPI003F728B4B
MKLRSLALALAGCLAAAPTLAGGWLLAESEHFTLYSSAQESVTRDYLKQLEAFRWLGLKLLGADDKNVRTQGRSEIQLLEGQSALHELRPTLPYNVAGAYYFCAEGSLMYATQARTLGPDGWDTSRLVLQHEYAHQLMFQYATRAYPGWYVEGFAEYMGTAAYEDGAISLGGQHQDRLPILATPPWLPFEDVLRWNSRDWKQLNRFEVDRLYAQSWLLTHYMLSESKRTQALADYFARVGAGEDSVAAFESATGITVADLIKTLNAYRRALPMVKIRSAEIPVPTIRMSPLSEEATKLALDSGVLRTCPKPEVAQEILERLRSQASKPSPAAGLQLSLVLARAEALFGDPAAAVKRLEGIVGAEDAPHEAHYLMARALTRQADQWKGDEQRAALDKARSHLFKAYRLKKDDPPTLYFLAQAVARNGMDKNALNAAQAARLLAPSVPEYALFEARADLEMGDRERAVRALIPLATDPHQPERAERVRHAIEAIQSGKTPDELASTMNPKP